MSLVPTMKKNYMSIKVDDQEHEGLPELNGKLDVTLKHAYKDGAGRLWRSVHRYTQMESLNDFEMINPKDDDEDNVEPAACSVLSCVIGTLCFPMGLFSCFVTQPKEEVVLLDYGKYNGTVKDPGCHWVCNAGRTMHRISTKVKSIKIPETKTIDKNGNPLVVNGILAYQIRNSKRATLDVENVSTYALTQSVAAMKQIVARYSYESENDINLKNNADEIAKQMITILQGRVQIAGVNIYSFTFNEISYATEIAAAMLKKQQAQAVLQARTVIVQGAVEIASSAVKELSNLGVQLDDDSRVEIVSNLLIVTCSDGSSGHR